MVRRLMGNVSREEDKTLRKSTNVASIRLVEKLGLETSIHLNPCALQYPSGDGELMVNKQVSIVFIIGKYVDEVMCDVIPIEASHLLLGKP